MTRNEYERRKSASDAFMRLTASDDWHVIDDMLVDIVNKTNDTRLLDIAPEAVPTVMQMLKGRLECIDLIRDYMAQWIADRALNPSEIDPEDTNAPSDMNS